MICAGVAELADALGLGPSAFGRAGSNPVPSTRNNHESRSVWN